MNQYELLTVVERWKIIRDDFSDLDRTDPGIIARLNGQFSMTSGEPEENCPAETGLFAGQLYCDRMVWVLARAENLLDETLEYGLLENDAPNEANARQGHWTLGGQCTTVSQFIRAESGPETNSFMRFVRWFLSGYVDASACDIHQPFRAARDACSFIAEEVLLKLGGQMAAIPQWAIANWKELSPSELATIFELHPETITDRLKRQLIRNFRITSKKYIVDPVALPSDWEVRLALSKGRLTKSD